MAAKKGTTVTVVYNKFPQIHAQMDQMIGRAIKKATLDVEAGAKRAAPVDTGALRNSIQHTFPGKHHGRVTVGQDYGIYVEFGTYRTPARPYLFPAVDRVAPSLKQALKGLK